MKCFWCICRERSPSCCSLRSSHPLGCLTSRGLMLKWSNSPEQNKGISQGQKMFNFMPSNQILILILWHHSLSVFFLLICPWQKMTDDTMPEVELNFFLMIYDIYRWKGATWWIRQTMTLKFFCKSQQDRFCYQALFWRFSTFGHWNAFESYLKTKRVKTEVHGSQKLKTHSGFGRLEVCGGP